jgi:hypothetical protein
MADVASIGSPYVLQGASLVSPHFDNEAKRYYLSDHNEAVELNEEIGIDAYQLSLLKRAGVEL